MIDWWLGVALLYYYDDTAAYGYSLHNCMPYVHVHSCGTLWLSLAKLVCMHAVLGLKWATCSDNIEQYCSVHLYQGFATIVLQDMSMSPRRLLWGKLTWCLHYSAEFNTIYQACCCCEPLNLEQHYTITYLIPTLYPLLHATLIYTWVKAEDEATLYYHCLLVQVY